MRRIATLVTAVALLAFAPVPLRARSEAQGLAPHSIFVTILDARGTPLRDLAPADFIVREGGQPREVATATLATDPLAIALVIDTSKPQIGRDLPIRDIRAGLTAFVQAIYAANPASTISLMDISGAAVKTVSDTSKPDQMLKAVSRVVTSQRSSGVLLEGLTDTGKDLAKAKTPRRAIVVLSFDAPEASTMQPRDAAMAVQKSGAMFWAVVIGSGSSATREVMFENLPGLTGGRRLSAVEATALTGMLGQVADALTGQYEVTFQGAGTDPAGLQAGARKGTMVLRAPWVR